MRVKYTRDLLVWAVSNSVSIAGVLRFLGLRQSGGSHSHITRKIKLYGLDISHFTGATTNSGPNHKGSIKTPFTEVLVKRTTGTRQQAFRLRRCLVEAGVPYLCTTCGIGTTWCSKELKLQVNHKNQDWLDDRLENLEFLCPNCHSQTDGWCGSKGGAELFSTGLQGRLRRKRRANGKVLVMETLGVSPPNECEVSSSSLHTKKPRPRKGTWPDPEKLQELLLDNPATEVAKMVGVTSTALKKMCNRLGLATRPLGYWAKLRKSQKV